MVLSPGVYGCVTVDVKWLVRSGQQKFSTIVAGLVGRLDPDNPYVVCLPPGLLPSGPSPPFYGWLWHTVEAKTVPPRREPYVRRRG